MKTRALMLVLLCVQHFGVLVSRGADFNVADYNALPGDQRVAFILALLDKRDHSLSNFAFKAHVHVHNVVLSSGASRFATSYDYEARRLNQTLWWDAVTHLTGKDTDEIRIKMIQSWNGQESRRLGFPPYDGQKYHVGRIDAKESSTVNQWKLDSLMGLRGYMDIKPSPSLARWIERFRDSSYSVEAPPIDERDDKLLSIQITLGPSVRIAYFLDPAHDFMICKVTDITERPTVKDILVVDEFDKVQDVWVPKRAVETVLDSTTPDRREETYYEFRQFSIGNLVEADVAVEFPVGSEVIDSVRKIAYYINPDGTFRLTGVGDKAEDVVRVPTTKLVNKIDNSTTQLYKPYQIAHSDYLPPPSTSKRVMWLILSAVLLCLALGYWSIRIRRRRPIPTTQTKA